MICLMTGIQFCTAQHMRAKNFPSYLGGDISLLPTYQQKGSVYRDSTGKAVEPITLLTQNEWNTIRIRLFVEPDKAPDEHKREGVCQDLPYIMRLAKQVKNAGMKLMLDFHYSDTWADPAKQFTPSRWTNIKNLNDSVYGYTRDVLKRMNDAGLAPEFIQIGNEITFGMLWPSGKTDPEKDDNWNMLARYLNAGAKACREECPNARIIIHTERAQSWKTTKAYYKRLQRFGVDYDIIGLSYYPMWHGTISNLGEVLDSIDATFHKPVMIVETAAYYSHKNDRWNKASSTVQGGYEVSKEGQRQFAHELVNELRKHHNVHGLFWWFPEENESGQTVVESWLNRGLFDNETGQALPAFYELKKFIRKNPKTGNGASRRY